MKVERFYDEATKMMHRRTTWEEIDEETGEVQHHAEEKIETYRGPKYIRVFPEAMRIAQLELNKNEYHALWFIVSKLIKTTNIACINYSDLREYLGVSDQSVANIMGKLQTADIVRMYRRGQWMLNPTLGTAAYEATRGDLVDTYFSLRNNKAPGPIDYIAVTRNQKIKNREERKARANEQSNDSAT